MGGRRPGNDPDETFGDLIPGVKPLSPDARSAPARPRRRARGPAEPAPEPIPFEVVRQGEWVTGLARGVDRRQLRQLSRGERRVEACLDLHRHPVPRARREITRTVEQGHRDGLRCLLVIHGRGLHSEERPVLREALLESLTEPPLDRIVLAFASALPRDGGPGATYVLLRRPTRRP
jgi:DNA-nicking Smr family endonuclease